MNITLSTLEKYAREYDKLAEEIKALEERKETLRLKFHEELGHESKTKVGKYTISTYMTTRPTVSGKVIKEEYPDIFAKYGKDTTYPSVRVTCK